MKHQDISILRTDPRGSAGPFATYFRPREVHPTVQDRVGPSKFRSGSACREGESHNHVNLSLAATDSDREGSIHAQSHAWVMRALQFQCPRYPSLRGLPKAYTLTSHTWGLLTKKQLHLKPNYNHIRALKGLLSGF